MPAILLISQQNQNLVIQWQLDQSAQRLELYRSEQDRFVSSTLLDTLDADLHMYIDVDVLANSVYYYWLKACSDLGCSEVSQSYRIEVSTIYPDRLNDTGISWEGDTGLGWTNAERGGNYNTCNSAALLLQDCHQGRDALSAGQLAKVGDGRAGFDFSKLDMAGKVLDASVEQWACVRDNHTGVVWERKTDDEGIHGSNRRFRWGGVSAIGRDRAEKFGSYYADWDGLVEASNQQQLCGYSDWRVPDAETLRSIVDYSRAAPAIDEDYFPNTGADFYWSANPDSEESGFALALDFGDGSANFHWRIDALALRLARVD